MFEHAYNQCLNPTFQSRGNPESKNEYDLIDLIAQSFCKKFPFTYLYKPIRQSSKSTLIDLCRKFLIFVITKSKYFYVISYLASSSEDSVVRLWILEICAAGFLWSSSLEYNGLVLR